MWSMECYYDECGWSSIIHVHVQCHVYEQSIREMLRKARQQQQHNRKAKQHNTTHSKLKNESFFKEKLAASGGTRTHDHQLAR